MKIAVSSLQWMAFLISGSIVAPIAISDLYGLNPAETAGFVQRTMFVLGLSSLLQALFGHRLPINEGPAGLWWGVFTIYAGLSTTLFSSKLATLQALQGAIIVSGIVFILFSLFNWIEKIAKLFTPVVLGTYLLLLVLQLSGSFISGMLGVGYRKDGVDLSIAIFSLVLVLFSSFLTNHKKKWISQYSILITLAVGWFFFSLLGFGGKVHFSVPSVVQFPELFPFGKPTFDLGLIITSIFITLLLMTNMIASIQIVAPLVENEKKKEQGNLRKASLIAGINHFLSSIFSSIGSVPISGAAGFIATTKITSIIPFCIGSGMVILSSFFPHLMAFFASLPTPVGYAAIFIVFANMISLAFSQFDQEKDTKRIRFVIGTSLLCGIGAMFVSGSAFKDVPPVAASLLNNGLILGSVVAIIVDQLTKKKSNNL